MIFSVFYKQYWVCKQKTKTKKTSKQWTNKDVTKMTLYLFEHCFWFFPHKHAQNNTKVQLQNQNSLQLKIKGSQMDKKYDANTWYAEVNTRKYWISHFAAKWFVAPEGVWLKMQYPYRILGLSINPSHFTATLKKKIIFHQQWGKGRKVLKWRKPGSYVTLYNLITKAQTCFVCLSFFLALYIWPIHLVSRNRRNLHNCWTTTPVNQGQWTPLRRQGLSTNLL